jgi:hypothetical protein
LAESSSPRDNVRMQMPERGSAAKSGKVLGSIKIRAERFFYGGLKSRLQCNILE